MQIILAVLYLNQRTDRAPAPAGVHCRKVFNHVDTDGPLNTNPTFAQSATQHAIKAASREGSITLHFWVFMALIKNTLLSLSLSVTTG